MGLLKCPDCGNDKVSSRAVACPICGCPVEAIEPAATATAGASTSDVHATELTLSDDGSLMLAKPSLLQEAIQVYGQSLRSLHLMGQDWRDAHFELLSEFRILESVQLTLCSMITDLTLISISRCYRLRRLDLGNLAKGAVEALGPTGLQHLAKLSTLEWLKFSTYVFLNVKKSSPTGQAIAILQQRLPMCAFQNLPVYA